MSDIPEATAPSYISPQAQKIFEVIQRGELSKVASKFDGLRPDVRDEVLTHYKKELPDDLHRKFRSAFHKYFPSGGRKSRKATKGGRKTRKGKTSRRH